MKITITMDLTAENLSKLKSLLPDEQIPGQVSMFDAPLEAPVEQTTPEPTPASVELAPEPAAAAAEPSVNKTDIRAVALKLSKAGKQKELAAAFGKFGCKKLSDFDSRPEDYPALMRELVSVDA